MDDLRRALENLDPATPEIALIRDLFVKLFDAEETFGIDSQEAMALELAIQLYLKEFFYSDEKAHIH